MHLVSGVIIVSPYRFDLEIMNVSSHSIPSQLHIAAMLQTQGMDLPTKLLTLINIQTVRYCLLRLSRFSSWTLTQL